MREKLEISVREACETDHAVIREITLDVFGATTYEKNLEDEYGRIAGKNWQWRKVQHLEADLSAKNGVCLVAMFDGKVCGYITILLDHDSKIGVIPNLAVKKQASNQGVGRRLLEEGKKAMRKAGMEIARIETLEQNPVGQHLYPQVGFTKLATQIYYALDLRDKSQLDD